ncbi:MAG: alpha/beta fold hydrolase [Dehalococcoidia bacterium]
MAFVENSGVRIWYEAMGEGPPLVLVYGIGANSRRWWTSFPERLAEHNRVIMLDNRGVGRSDQPSEPWSAADIVADLQAVVEANGLDTFHLLGCSLGSLMVRYYAGAHGDRLRSLSLLCPPNGTPATPDDMKLGILWDPNVPRVENERKSWPVVHPEMWARDHEAELLADFELAEAERTPGRTFFFQMKATGDAGDPNPRLNDFDWPVMVLHGTIDRLVPPKNAETLHAAVPRSELRWLEGASHSFWQHDPEGTADSVLDFVGRAEAAWRQR